MKSLFVDTSAWIAVTDNSDQLHGPAEAFYRQAFAQYRALATTSLVLAETYALLRRGMATDRVLFWLDSLLTSPRVEVVHASRGLIDQARTLLAQYEDQLFSPHRCRIIRRYAKSRHSGCLRLRSTLPHCGIRPPSVDRSF